MFYHATNKENLKVLEPLSKCNENKTLNVVYFTENKAYSYFYIWDEVRTKRKIKWVTCWLKDGIVYYEEQFPNQLKKFYKNVTGCIYSVDKIKNLNKAKEPQMWYSTIAVDNFKIEKIDNVYNKILEEENKGNIVIYRYNKLSKEDKYKVDKKMCDGILFKNYLYTNNDDSLFMRKHHKSAWKMAKKLTKQK